MTVILCVPPNQFLKAHARNYRYRYSEGLFYSPNTINAILISDKKLIWLNSFIGKIYHHHHWKFMSRITQMQYW